jgi:nicotinate phosphoribosyltransferase
LNEYKIKKIIDNNAPIDAFGVGTELATSRDDPTISGVYKLIEYNKKPRIKISEEKITYPGIKQVDRLYGDDGLFQYDLLALESEAAMKNTQPLLRSIMKRGKLIVKLPSLDEVQWFYNENIKSLPEHYKTLDEIHVDSLKISKKLIELTNSLKEKHS